MRDKINLKEIKVKERHIYMCDLGEGVGSEQNGVRPVLIVKNQKGCDNGTIVTIIPITSKLNKGSNMMTHVSVGEESGLHMSSEIITEQTRTISKSRLLFDGELREIGEVSDYIYNKVGIALNRDMGFKKLYFDKKEAFRMFDALYSVQDLGKDNPALRFIAEQIKKYCNDYNEDYNELNKMYMQKVRMSNTISSREYTSNRYYQ